MSRLATSGGGRPAVPARDPVPAHPGARPRRPAGPGDSARRRQQGCARLAGCDLRPRGQLQPHHRSGRLPPLRFGDRRASFLARALQAIPHVLAASLPSTSCPPSRRASAHAPQAAPAGTSDHSTKLDRQAAWVATETIGDALERWFNLLAGGPGHGLYRGSFNVSGGYYSYGPLVLRFKSARFVPNLNVSGTATVEQGVVAADGTVEPDRTTRAERQSADRVADE